MWTTIKYWFEKTGFVAVPSCDDEWEGEEEGDGGGVVEPEYAGVDGDRVGFHQPLQAAEYVQHVQCDFLVHVKRMLRSREPDH